jgi:hypothetical protein
VVVEGNAGVTRVACLQSSPNAATVSDLCPICKDEQVVYVENVSGCVATETDAFCAF